MGRLSSGRRKRQSTRSELPKIFIFVEGRTEWHYFNGFKRYSRGAGVFLEIPKTVIGRSGVRLLQEALDFLQYHGREKDDRVFVVFDRDSQFDGKDISMKDLNQIRSKARKNDIEIIFSDDAFEVWLVLHYQPLTSSTTRNDLNSLLTKHLGKTYTKPAKNLFNTLVNESDAISRAKKLPFGKNPSTNVYKLVELLRTKIN